MGELVGTSAPRERVPGDYVPVRGEQVARLFRELTLVDCGLDGETMVWRFRGGMVLRQHSNIDDHLALAAEEVAPDAG